MTFKFKLLSLMAVMLFGFSLLQSASAQGVINFSNTNAVSLTAQSVGDGQVNLFFTTGNNLEGYNLDYFALLLASNPNTAGLQTYANLDSNSGQILNDFNWESMNHLVSATESADVFTPDSIGSDTSLLAANTSYEIIFFWFGGNSLNLDSAENPPVTTDTGWNYGGATFPFDPSFQFDGNPAFAIGVTPITAVPEPSIYSLAALAGFAGCSLLLYRKLITVENPRTLHPDR